VARRNGERYRRPVPGIPAASFAVRAESPERLVSTAAEAVRSLGRPSGMLLLLSGGLALRAREVGEALAQAELGVPVLLATGAGVLTERGELEAQSAAAGLVFSGGRPEALALTANTPDDSAVELADTLSNLTRGTRATVLLFAQSRGFGVESLEPFTALPGTTLFGAGTPGDAPIFAIGSNGRLERGSLGALVVRGVSPALVRSSPACRALMPLRPITRARGPLLLEIGGEPALDVLEAVAKELRGQPLVLTLLAPAESAQESARPELLVRGVQGVDPARRAIMLAGELTLGSRVAFAVKDGGAARRDLELVVRDLARETAGAAPLFGIYLNCASRGAELYGAPDVDVRILRGRFPEVPLIGMQSAFEIAPYLGRPALHLYSGVFAMFTSPS
jgi:small ligand-binding sensory domain FIST